MLGLPWADRVGIEGFESLERVFDELYEDRRSGDARRVGIEDAALVRGVNGLEAGDGGMAFVSRVREELTFFDD